MFAGELKLGAVLDRGLVYRLVPNTIGSYDYAGRKPGKQAFRPDAGERGISVFLADLADADAVIRGFNGYGVCEFTIEDLLAEVDRLRASTENDFDEAVSVTFDPNRSHPYAGHAHCYIEPVPGIIQKALCKRVAKMKEGYMPGPAVAGNRIRIDPA